ncbi:hypothetical protein ACC848_05775, partial [Rhizobium johnstonii]|uniref:hypothetical protein n=1 Tax=Rhizobium johnstonii TaxID=3019933 RepID=UPI003F9834D8
GWSSPVARQAHNLKAAGSNPAPATKLFNNIVSYLASPAHWTFDLRDLGNRHRVVYPTQADGDALLHFGVE